MDERVLLTDREPLLKRYLGLLDISIVVPETPEAQHMQAFLIDLVEKLLTERKTPTISFNECLHRVEEFVKNESQTGLDLNLPEVESTPPSAGAQALLPQILESVPAIIENAVWAVVAFTDERRAGLNPFVLEAVCLARVAYASCRKFPGLGPRECLGVLRTLCMEPPARFLAKHALVVLDIAENFVKLIAVCGKTEADDIVRFDWRGLSIEELLREIRSECTRITNLLRKLDQVYRGVVVTKSLDLFEEFTKFLPEFDVLDIMADSVLLGNAYVRQTTLGKARGEAKQVEELQVVWGSSIVKYWLVAQFLNSVFFQAIGVLPKGLQSWLNKKCELSKEEALNVFIEENTRCKAFLDILVKEQEKVANLKNKRVFSEFIAFAVIAGLNFEHLQLAIFVHRLGRDKTFQELLSQNGDLRRGIRDSLGLRMRKQT